MTTVYSYGWNCPHCEYELDHRCVVTPETYDKVKWETPEDVARNIAHALRSEASKWAIGYYDYNKYPKGYDYCTLFYGLEQIMLNFAESVKIEPVEEPKEEKDESGDRSRIQ